MISVVLTIYLPVHRHQGVPHLKCGQMLSAGLGHCWLRLCVHWSMTCVFVTSLRTLSLTHTPTYTHTPWCMDKRMSDMFSVVSFMQVWKVIHCLENNIFIPHRVCWCACVHGMCVPLRRYLVLYSACIILHSSSTTAAALLFLSYRAAKQHQFLLDGFVNFGLLNRKSKQTNNHVSVLLLSVWRLFIGLMWRNHFYR